MVLVKLHPLVRLAGAAALAGALALPFAGVASAHAFLVRANIRPGQVFKHNTYPRTLAAYFAENVNPKGSFLHVFEDVPGSDHGLVDLGTDSFPFKNQKEITVKLPRGLKGTYMVMWFTVSADDGHEAGSAFTFSVK